MPTPKQMEKLAAIASRNVLAIPTPGPADEMPLEYWQAVFNDASADARPSGSPIQKQQLGDIQRHVLRVTCRRCARTVEIQKADAIRLAGPGRSGRTLASDFWTTRASNVPAGTKKTAAGLRLNSCSCARVRCLNLGCPDGAEASPYAALWRRQKDS
jgi:hypothetical protein